MTTIMGLIDLNENCNEMLEMSRLRPLAAFPFAGRYRLIDFVLSNMINSGVSNVAILPKGNYRSLMDHLRSGKEWDLARKKDGMFFLFSNATENESTGYNWSGFNKNLIDLHNNLDYLRRSTQKYVVVTGSSMVCNINYRDIMKFHIERKADVTIVYKDYEDIQNLSGATMIETGDKGRIMDMEVLPVKPRSNKLSMAMYFLERQLLIDLIDITVSRGGTSLLRDCFLKNLYNLKIYGYSFPGYVARINSYESYYKHSMDLLNPDVYQELFFQNGSIFTKVKDEPPTKYLKDSKVQGCLVANGSIIGGTIKNSILFRGIRVSSDAKITNSIIMQKAVIGKGVVLENVICDKDVVISDGKKLKGDPSHPMIIGKGSVI